MRNQNKTPARLRKKGKKCGCPYCPEVERNLEGIDLQRGKNKVVRNPGEGGTQI